MAITTSPRGTDPPRRSAGNDKPEKVTTHPTSKRKPEADGEAKVDDNDITKSHDSRTMANIAKTA